MRSRDHHKYSRRTPQAREPASLQSTGVVTPRCYSDGMGSAWSRKQATIDASFEAAPRDVTAWDLQHVKILHDKFRDGGYDFGMDRASLRDLITSALPTARALTGDFWDAYAGKDQDMLYPLELFAALAFQCHGLSRDKAGFLFDMFDFGGREESSYDEVAICISTAVGALSKVSGPCRLLDEASVDKLADDAYVVAGSDVSVPLSKADFFKWVNKGLKIDLSADLTIEDVGKALGLWTDEEQQRKQLGADVFDPEGHQEAKSIDAAAETTGVTGGDKERK